MKLNLVSKVKINKFNDQLFVYERYLLKCYLII